MSAWTVIGHTEVGSGGATDIIFSSIAGTYTDLCLMLSARATGSNATGDMFFEFNDSTADFEYRHIWGNGATADAYGQAGNYAAWISGGGNTSNTFGSITIYIPNYSSDTSKLILGDVVTENNATTAYQSLNSHWRNNGAAITKIRLYLSNGNFAQYSSATLYGITKGSSGGVTVS